MSAGDSVGEMAAEGAAEAGGAVEGSVGAAATTEGGTGVLAGEDGRAHAATARAPEKAKKGNGRRVRMT